MSVENSEAENTGDKPGAPQLVGKEPKKKGQAPHSPLTAEQRVKLEADFQRTVDYVSHINPAFGKLFKAFKGLVSHGRKSGSREADLPSEKLGAVLKNVEGLATKTNPTLAELARYPGLKSFDGKPETLEANTRAILEDLIKEGSLQMDPAQKQAIFEHIPLMVKEGYIDGSYSVEKMAQNMESFIKAHGDATIDAAFRLDSKPTQLKVTHNADLSYGMAMRASDIKGGFLTSVGIQYMEPNGTLMQNGTMTMAALVRELGGNINDITVQALHKTDTGLKLEAGKTPPAYVTGYFVQNSKTGQGYYLGTDSVDLGGISTDLKTRRLLTDDLLKKLESPAATDVKPAVQSASLNPQQDLAFKV